ncbi:MAG TPA: DNA polymerase/3'-5' exonuclease PolX [Elusimicrobiota bacterium]|nr:DNA polymerase/3'-5' exonuclease PolX [Elusimicrobiota bacterium]
MIDQSAIASILEDIGTLLELKGDNPFKARAYHNASRIVANFPQAIDAAACRDVLPSVKGLGESICEKIATLVTTGRLPYYDDLQKSLPAGLLEMVRVQGVGPKRAKILYDQLKIKDIAALEKACRDGKVAALDGFGEKSQENILKGIAFLSRHAESRRFDEAQAAADRVLEPLAQLPGVARVSVCGSLRRRKEIIRDVDILAGVSADGREDAGESKRRPGAIVQQFVDMPFVDRVLGQGDTKASVLLNDGIQVDLRVVDDAQFPYALHYFTGSKEHNIAMRQRAIARGLRLNEYGLFKVPPDAAKAATGAKADGAAPSPALTLIPCKDETELFKKLDLPYIPPEIREDRGEIEAAEKNALPRLIEAEDIRGVFHVHSAWSDGRAPLDEMVAEAQRLGWEYVGISDHSRSAAYAHGLTVDRVKKQRVEIDKLRKKYKIRIFWGTECDILKDGSMDYPPGVLAAYDFVIASVHSNFNLPESDQTRRMVTAMKNQYVTILGHMTGRLILQREPYAVNVDELLTAAAGQGVAIELNANPRRFDIDWRHLPRAREKGVKISVNPDAHSVAELSLIPLGVGIGRKGWLSKEDVINTRRLPGIIQWLKDRS